MRVAALLHPRINSEKLDAFHASDVEIVQVQDLSDDKSFKAALIFGGDGTIHRHLRALIQRKIPVLVVPFGSGNDFARSLGINSRRAALHAWNKFCAGGNNVRAVDVGLIQPLSGAANDEIYFCNIAGVGLDAEANRRANAQPRWLRCHGGYLLAALAAMTAFRPQFMTLRLEGGPAFRGSALFIAIANGSSYGGGMRIAPRASLDDGLLDVCIVRAMNKFRLLFHFPGIFRGAHLAMEEVEYLRSASLRLDSAQSLPIYADGEICGCTPLAIRCLRRALRVIVPA